MKKVFLTIIVILFTFGVLFSQDVPKVRTKQLSENLHLINVAGVNSVILTGKEGTFLVDDNTEKAAPFLLKEICSITKDIIKFIVNTHWHFDHTEGNIVFGNGKKIIADENVKTLLSKDEMLLGELHIAYPEYAIPNITFKDKYEMNLNDETVIITSLSGGHSAGDAIVYFKNADVLHIGDIVFADMFPFVDVDHGGNAITLSNNIKTITDMFTVNTRIVPGHGRMLTTEDLKEYRDMINGTIEIVKQEVSKNKSLAEIKESNLLNDYADWQVAFNFDDWIEILYKSIKQK